MIALALSSPNVLTTALLAQSVDGSVRTAYGKGVAHALITVEEDNSAKPVTTDTGAFSLQLGANLHLNMDITLHVQGWVVVQPCDLQNGRVYLHDPLGGPINVKVFRRGDPALIDAAKEAPVFDCMIEEEIAHFPRTSRKGKDQSRNSTMFLGIPGQFNVPNISVDGIVASDAYGFRELHRPMFIEAALHSTSIADTQPTGVMAPVPILQNGPSPPDLDSFVERKAAEFGLSPAVLVASISKWYTSTTDPYAKGIYAIYSRRYNDGIRLLHDFANTTTDRGAMTYVFVGSAQYELGLYADAQSSLRRALSRFPSDLLVMNNLAVVLNDEGKYAEAAQWITNALGRLPSSSNVDPTLAARLLATGAMSQYQQAHYDGAEALYKRALALSSNTTPAYVEILSNLGDTYVHEQKYQEAFDADQEAMKLGRAILPPDDPMLSGAVFNVANFMLGAQDLDDAETLFQEALSIDEAHYGKDHPELIPDLLAISQVQFDIAQRSGGDYSEVQVNIDRAKSLCQKYLSPNHPRMAEVFVREAFIYDAQKKYSASESLYRAALAIDEQAYGKESVKILWDLEYLAGDLFDEKKFADSADVYKRAIAIEENANGETGLVADYLAKEGVALEQAGKAAEAIVVYKQAVDLGQRVFVGPRSSQRPLLANVVDRLIGLLKETGHTEDVTTYEKLAAGLRNE